MDGNCSTGFEGLPGDVASSSLLHRTLLRAASGLWEAITLALYRKTSWPQCRCGEGRIDRRSHAIASNRMAGERHRLSRSAGRVGAVMCAAVVAAACSSSASVTTTSAPVTSSVPASAPPTPVTSPTTAVPTSATPTTNSTSVAATTAQNPAAAAEASARVLIKAATDDFSACLVAMPQCDVASLAATRAGPLLERNKARIQEWNAAGYTVRNRERFRFVIETVTVNAADSATALVCIADGSRLVKPGAGPGGAEVVIDESYVSGRETWDIRLDPDGRWRVYDASASGPSESRDICPGS